MVFIILLHLQASVALTCAVPPGRRVYAAGRDSRCCMWIKQLTQGAQRWVTPTPVCLNVLLVDLFALSTLKWLFCQLVPFSTNMPAPSLALFHVCLPMNRSFCFLNLLVSIQLCWRQRAGIILSPKLFLKRKRKSNSKSKIKLDLFRYNKPIV